MRPLVGRAVAERHVVVADALHVGNGRIVRHRKAEPFAAPARHRCLSSAGLYAPPCSIVSGFARNCKGCSGRYGLYPHALPVIPEAAAQRRLSGICRMPFALAQDPGSAQSRLRAIAAAGMTGGILAALTPHGGLEAGGFGFALGAEPALPARLLDAAAVVVGRSGQHVDAGPAGHQALDRAAVGGAALGLVPGLGAELAGTLHLAGGPDAGLGVARLPFEAR